MCTHCVVHERGRRSVGRHRPLARVDQAPAPSNVHLSTSSHTRVVQRQRQGPNNNAAARWVEHVPERCRSRGSRRPLIRRPHVQFMLVVVARRPLDVDRPGLKVRDTGGDPILEFRYATSLKVLVYKHRERILSFCIYLGRCVLELYILY